LTALNIIPPSTELCAHFRTRPDSVAKLGFLTVLV
jgi:hypothetical protein